MQVAERQLEPETPPAPPPPAPARPVRLWPLVVLLTLYWGFVIGSNWLELTTFARFMSRLAASSLLTLVFLVWWWANRRIPLGYRAYGFAVAVLGGVGAGLVAHPSVGGFGLLMGPVAVVLTAWVLWLLVSKTATPSLQRVGLCVTLSLAWVLLTLIRLDGLTGDLQPDMHWRWSQTPEEAYQAERRAREAAEGPVSPLPDDTPPLVLRPGDWPGFRGPDRDGTVRGVKIATDWSAAPPRRLWRRRVGPACSSVVVVGGRLFTQEQRGEREAVVCCDAATGKEVWSHEDAGRFWEPTAGAGPRATPTFGQGNLYALGATGTLNCLDAATGRLHWARDVKGPSGAAVPPWGYSGSPLIVGNLVVVFAGGESGQDLLAYRAGSGKLAWAASAGQTSYSSPQLATLAGRRQILMLTNRGLASVDATRGTALWEHSIPLPPSAPRSVQPHAFGSRQVLLASEADLGLALLDLQKNGDDWSATQLWASKDLKPAFNDFVVQGGHAYGFDGRIFGCVELEGGTRRWKKGRYGHGQVLLLAEQQLLLVLSEKGEAILLRASPERSEEMGRFQAVRGKTWAHPVLAHGRLYVRNGEEMACYEVGIVGQR
jgi:outer membrane protein assembly factor BamB